MTSLILTLLLALSSRLPQTSSQDILGDPRPSPVDPGFNIIPPFPGTVTFTTFPSCARPCLSAALSSAGCSPQDAGCICAHSAYASQIACCVASSCALGDQTTVVTTLLRLCLGKGGFPAHLCGSTGSTTPQSSIPSVSLPIPSSTTPSSLSGFLTLPTSLPPASPPSTSPGQSAGGGGGSNNPPKSAVSESAPPSTTTTTAPSPIPGPAQSGLSPGAKAGIALGALVGTLVLLFLIWTAYRRGIARGRGPIAAGATTAAAAVEAQLPGSWVQEKAELDGGGAGDGAGERVSMIKRKPVGAEVADKNTPVAELPAERGD